MKVIAIVVTYKRKELLNKVLHRLLQQSYSLDKVIVVDNNSQDGTDVLVNSLISDNYNIEYHNTGGNLGGAGGFNFGFKLASNYDYDHLWLMDDDFLPSINCLKELLSHNINGITQPIRFNLDGTCAEISPVTYDLKKIFCKNPKSTTIADIYHNLRDCDSISIAGVPFEGPLISKSVVDSIGYPNSDFFIFNDDLDYSIRARNAGYDIICSFKASAQRLLVNNQSDDLKSWKGYFMLRNHFYILREYGENFFVKNRSLAIAFFYFSKAFLSQDKRFLKIILRAYKDSFNLKNNDMFKP
ncbi:glycosyltransferase [Aliivibrio sp. S10_S31]|uniref:glycosyltransferase n=1 Tax=Aliivibrio sp. S10_S31 TaxID=2720224 RepID=UPI0016801FAF|nr:glycosyltransferase [Aliivibrio sp. S10_S31]MBD1571477.1 glycosyltransferase [Aliivibrio sp. S10_S31]